MCTCAIGSAFEFQQRQTYLCSNLIVLVQEMHVTVHFGNKLIVTFIIKFKVNTALAVLLNIEERNKHKSRDKQIQ